MLLENLKYLMSIHGHSGQDLADELDVSYATVTRYLTGAIKITTKKLKAISQIYKVEPKDLMTIDLQKQGYDIEDHNIEKEISELKEMHEALIAENKALRKQVELLRRKMDEGSDNE